MAFTEEISEPIAGSSARAGQLNTGEESCPRRSDVGVGCPEVMLSGHDVGTASDQL
jgi:hypothetical protein